MRKTSDDWRVSTEERGPKIKGSRLTKKEVRRQASHYLEKDKVVTIFDWRDYRAIARNIFL